MLQERELSAQPINWDPIFATRIRKWKFYVSAKPRSFAYSASPLVIIVGLYSNYMSRMLLPTFTGLSRRFNRHLDGDLPRWAASDIAPVSDLSRDKLTHCLTRRTRSQAACLTGWPLFQDVAWRPQDGLETPLPSVFSCLVQIAAPWLAPFRVLAVYSRAVQTKSECSYRTAKLELPFVTDGIRSVLVGRLSVNLQSIRGVSVYGTMVGLIVLRRLN